MQVSHVLDAVQAAGCQRSAAAEEALPRAKAGILRSQVKDDFRAVFDKDLDHAAMGHIKLGCALQQHCSDFLAAPSTINQFCTVVRIYSELATHRSSWGTFHCMWHLDDTLRPFVLLVRYHEFLMVAWGPHLQGVMHGGF